MSAKNVLIKTIGLLLGKKFAKRAFNKFQTKEISDSLQAELERPENNINFLLNDNARIRNGEMPLDPRRRARIISGEIPFPSRRS
jgi:hypothetical protein